MREICTSGSVRGGGDNAPTYSAGLVNTPVVLGGRRLLECLPRSLNLTPQRGGFGIYGETCHQDHSQIGSELWPRACAQGSRKSALCLAGLTYERRAATAVNHRSA